MKKRLTYLVLTIVIAMGGYAAIDAATTNVQPQAQKTQITKPISSDVNAVIDVTPLELVSNPSAYLNRTIKMNATFDKFSTLGLDYAPALRKSEDFIGILVRRDDVIDHVMPLPELKIFLARKTAEKFIDLESGDKVLVEGKVFSCAMGDPWVEISKLTVISSKKPIKVN